MALYRLTSKLFCSLHQAPAGYLASHVFAYHKGSSVEEHIVHLTVVDKEGVRHSLRGLEGQALNDFLSENPIFGHKQMVMAPFSCGGWDMHVLVAQEFLPKLPALSEAEQMDLDDVSEEVKPNSRMASAVTLSKELDGLIVALGQVQPWETI